MWWYREVHRGPEMVQVLEVNVPLVDVKIWASAYLVCSHIHRSDMRRG